MNSIDVSKLLDISDLPNIEGEEIPIYPPLELKTVRSNLENRRPDLDSDYSIARQNLHFQSQMILDAAKVYLETAKNSESPRHMEVFAALMGQFTNVNKEILKLHKEIKDIDPKPVVETSQPKTVLGSPLDMMDQFGDSYEAKAKNGNT